MNNIFQATAKNSFNVRKAPFTAAPVVQQLSAGTVVNYVGSVKGENLQGNNIWFQGSSGNYFWSGAFASIDEFKSDIVLFKETEEKLIELFEEQFNMSSVGIPTETILLYMEASVNEPNSYSQVLTLGSQENGIFQRYTFFKEGYKEIHEAWEPHSFK